MFSSTFSRNGLNIVLLSSFLSLLFFSDSSKGWAKKSGKDTPKASQWVKYAGNPVLGKGVGTCFDVCLLRENQKFRMWFSWRDKKSIALVESVDGIHWGAPLLCLKNRSPFSWEYNVNRPIVIKKADGYHMWYTGQSRDFFFRPAHSFIGYAVSSDGENWRRVSSDPVLKPDQEWEKVAVMCPDVTWDEKENIYKMWYSGGDQGEPDAIGYAESADGEKWVKRSRPVFTPSPAPAWDSDKVTACQVLKEGSWYWMFYIGFSDFRHAQIGLARSPDGISHWQSYPGNPILSPTPGQWDEDAVYKPFALLNGSRWMLWYNGRRAPLEQIGLAFHPKLIPGWN